MTRLFGTDGVRGVANRELTPELAFAIGRAAITALGGDDRPRLVIGRDSRISGLMLESAMAAGACSAGGDVLRVGMVPTPAVAFMTQDLQAQAGAVVSASHNPAEDNGIKLFSGDGFKLPDEVEDEIERLVREGDGPRPQGGSVGRIVDAVEEPGRYLDHLAAAVLDRGADAGVAFDGDADRAMFADADGTVIDGDQVIAACALAMREAGRLAKDTVVVTVMANLGLRRALESAAVTVLETQVGDRYVLEEMRRVGAALGGEQSGHVIFLDNATTGDGLLTAVRFLTLAARRRVSVAELASAMRRFPQGLENVAVDDPAGAMSSPEVAEAIRGAEDALRERGRVLVRPSGTEPVVRVMVEAETEEEARSHAEAISASIRPA